ncbi:MAG TPA: DUF5996 family protein [Coleofasciculaceae cyanobacterium]|jgi:hypothetical protein
MKSGITAEKVGRSPIPSTDWPELPWSGWDETASTLQLWLQVVGKIRLVLATRINHWWHVTLYPTCRGLTTSPMPYGARMVQIDFDFTSHQLYFQSSDGFRESFPLEPMSVADFYQKVMGKMTQMGMPVKIWTMPCEIPDAIPFDQDHQHAAYDAAYVTRFWKILVQTDRVATKFRSRFTGKVSPVHFFWGGFDLAITRFSGRIAPRHASVPGVPDSVVQAAYSHEVSSFGFWPGGSVLQEPVFYAYAYPAPPGFSDATVRPDGAYFFQTLGEFVLPYEAVRLSNEPDQTLLDFMQSTYEAAADLGRWNRCELEAFSKEI